MEYLSQLVKTENSALGQYLRYSLQGLYASLESAFKEASSDDPGRSVCNQLLEELNQLLQGDAFDATVSENSSDSDTPKLLLQCLYDGFFGDETIRSHFSSDLKLRSNADSNLWDEIQKLLLRVPDPLAKEWQQKAIKLAQAVGAEADSLQVVPLPFWEDKLLYPGLAGTVDAKGLRLSTNFPLDSRISNDNLNEDLKFLAQVVSICLHFIEIDPALHHCLKRIYRFGITPFNSSKQKSQYIQTLLRCFREVKNSDNDPVSALKARLNLDEAINSLVYLPLADPNSWWGKLQKEERKTLDRAVERVRHEGHDVGCQWLLGVREDIIKYTKNEDDVLYQLKTGGIPGRIMACLRVYAWIDEEKLPGRVIYFPWRGDNVD